MTFNHDKWHFMQWDEEKIKVFWDFASHWEPWHADYFSHQVGVGIVNFLRHLTPLKGNVLDYGCGIGDLADDLLTAGISCEGIDYSPDSVEYINNRFSKRSLWKGAKLAQSGKLPYQDNHFDVIVCIELIEHLLPEQRENVFSELRRILKPDTGRLFITAPNSEILENSTVFCPECRTAYHRYQHMASFTAKTLSRLMQSLGYSTLFCNTTHFGRFQTPFILRPFSWSLGYLPELLRRTNLALLDLFFAKTAPQGGYKFQELIGTGAHLFWLGTK